VENKQKRLFLAESVSISEESKLNPIFLTVDVKLCDSAVNKNHEGVTEAFIDDVVNRQGDHVCLPFYADVKNLLAENYEQLGHLYNKVTRKFGTQMIGSMSEFYADTDENGIESLYGKIKVPKRDRDIVYRLVDLYEMGRFAVSVELTYNPKEVVLKDGGKFIEASENSSLTGLCLVWKPACEDAYALDMVAEEADDSEEIVAESEEQPGRGETSSMKEEEKIVAEEQEEQEEQMTAESEVEVQGEAEERVAVAENEDVSESSDEVAVESASEAMAEESVEEEQAEANAEVIEHSVDTHECIDNSGWYGDKPVHVIEYHERIIETLEDAGELIAELDKQIAELTEIKGKYDAMIAEAQEKVLSEKRACAKVFAEKQGLDVNDTAVAEAIENLDYAKIAELTMAEEQEPEEVMPEKQEVTLASFVEMEVGNDKYGGLLNRKNK
jgi:hypothetical protein